MRRRAGLGGFSLKTRITGGSINGLGVDVVSQPTTIPMVMRWSIDARSVVDWNALKALYQWFTIRMVVFTLSPQANVNLMEQAPATETSGSLALLTQQGRPSAAPPTTFAAFIENPRTRIVPCSYGKNIRVVVRPRVMDLVESVGPGDLFAQQPARTTWISTAVDQLVPWTGLDVFIPVVPGSDSSQVWQVYATVYMRFKGRN